GPVAPPTQDLERQLHRATAKVAADIERLAFNTAIAALIEFVNAATAGGAGVPPAGPAGGPPHGPLTRAQAERFTLILSPFAPHLAEEIWYRLGHTRTLAYEPWPEADERLLHDESVEMVVQINGKVRDRITVASGLDQKAIETAALAEPKVRALTEGKSVRKVIVVPGKLVNIVVG
ncbi:MAG: class I tRNA ligase family protein, partial [Phycisphaerales bacterium]